MPATRKARLAETLRAELSDAIRRELRDPRLTAGLLSITDVNVSQDLKYATAYISVLGDDKVRKDALNALSGASGVLRQELVRRKAFKSVPELHFRYDETLERAANLYSAIATAVRHDAELEAEHPQVEEDEKTDIVEADDLDPS
jgi:ribosome-binding factor A